jgi:hypothetical protein
MYQSDGSFTFSSPVTAALFEQCLLPTVLAPPTADAADIELNVSTGSEISLNLYFHGFLTGPNAPSTDPHLQTN